MGDTSFETIQRAIEVVRVDQNHPVPTIWQIRMVERLVKNQNSVNQLPTGSGKTWPVISLPKILDVLRDDFHQDLPKETRVLYIVPLVNIYHSLGNELETLKIPYQILTSGFGAISKIDINAKVVCLSPEKLLDKSVISSIFKLSWSLVSIDEPHLGKGPKVKISPLIEIAV